MSEMERAQFRTLMLEALSDGEITALCADYFPDVHNILADGLDKGQKIRRLLDHCTRRELLPVLLQCVQEICPERFADITRIVPPDPAPIGYRLSAPRAPTPDFVGRTEEIPALLNTLTSGNGTAAISGIREIGGLGKTELALVVASHLRETFPTQIMLHLAGASDAPLSPERALQEAIRPFAPAAKLPDDLPALQDLYLAYLDGRRVLILARLREDAAAERATRLRHARYYVG